MVPLKKVMGDLLKCIALCYFELAILYCRFITTLKVKDEAKSLPMSEDGGNLNRLSINGYNKQIISKAPVCRHFGVSNDKALLV
jgi:hypothetical protein